MPLKATSDLKPWEHPPVIKSWRVKGEDLYRVTIIFTVKNCGWCHFTMRKVN